MEVRAAEAGASEVRTDQIRVAEIRPAQIGADEPRATQVAVVLDAPAMHDAAARRARAELALLRRGADRRTGRRGTGGDRDGEGGDDEKAKCAHAPDEIQSPAGGDVFPHALDEEGRESTRGIPVGRQGIEPWPED